MVNITLDISKSIEQNAEIYFEKSKKAKHKLNGAKKAINEIREKLNKLNERKAEIDTEDNKKQIKRERAWYEKFHWFYSSENFLCIGGRDATTNDIIIKKYCSKGDLVFHTDLAGSPFFVVKGEGRDIGGNTIKEAAQATASYSRAWRLGITSLEVFYVLPEQLTKETNAGEYIGKGAFVVRGKTNYVHTELEIAIGCKDNMIIGGPVNAILSQTKSYVILRPGGDKSSDIAKRIRKEFGCGEIDEIIRFIPAGGSKVIKIQKAN